MHDKQTERVRNKAVVLISTARTMKDGRMTCFRDSQSVKSEEGASGAFRCLGALEELLSRLNQGRWCAVIGWYAASPAYCIMRGTRATAPSTFVKRPG